ncbi:MAG: phage tail tube protein [Sneathiella sp.]
MADNTAIGGTAYIKADGKQFSLAGSMTVMLDSEEREMQAGLSGIAGYNVTHIVPYIEGEFYDTTELSMEDLSNMTNVTITVELANGKVGTLRNAVNKGANEVDGEGKFTTRFEGMEGFWSKSQ